ncbi:hypothetical protein [Vulcanisaeta sp. JCM 16159]|uniref:hypothetical protein n=1 Tax=Vulcanisaeta sp. JCM 16159 TaxID=1295371 RepID=UPI0006D05256|nr:hypothetical protein [Vulcanisaeta sp. JCM 16159]
MPKKIVIVTADWDYFKDQLSMLCSQFIKAGIDCETMNYEDQEALRLIIKYGIDNGVVRIPQIYVIINGDVKRITYEITDDLRLVIKDLDNYLK